MIRNLNSHYYKIKMIIINKIKMIRNKFIINKFNQIILMIIKIIIDKEKQNPNFNKKENNMIKLNINLNILVNMILVKIFNMKKSWNNGD